jgi:hypothetical protein
MMPVRQQYFIAAAIIALIGVMVAFAMFDYFGDRDRFAEQMTLRSQGMVAPAGTPYSGAMNAAGLGGFLCSNCGWRGAGAGNGLCPNCRAYPYNMPNAGSLPMSGQNAAFTPGLNICRNCGWQGTGAGNGVCPNCRALLRNPNMGALPVNGQNAAFTWFNQQTPRAVAPRGVLYCPTCDFAMPSKHKAVPNSIRCPRCPAYLASSDAAANAGAGPVSAGQWAGWRPNCPLP